MSRATPTPEPANHHRRKPLRAQASAAISRRLIHGVCGGRILHASVPTRRSAASERHGGGQAGAGCSPSRGTERHGRPPAVG
jgi:hypothetical protein